MLSALVLALAPAVTAAPLPPVGPPAICFPLEIGDARSLRWGGGGMFAMEPAYPRIRVVSDVVSLLAGSDDALVHAETLRRAVIYLVESDGARKDPGVRLLRAELVSALRARVLELELAAASGEGDEHARALAWMDVGYAIGALEQIGAESHGTPLPMLQRARNLAPQDGGLALAAWLAAWTRGAHEDEQAELLAAAVRLAEDPEGLVRVNLMNVAGAFLGVDSYDELTAKVAASPPRGG
jgi:hypothetical protein